MDLLNSGLRGSGPWALCMSTGTGGLIISTSYRNGQIDIDD